MVLVGLLKKISTKKTLKDNKKIFFRLNFMEKRFTLHLKYAIVAIVLLILISFVSLMPSNELPKTSFKNFDKIIHIIMYFILSSFMTLGFANLKHKSVLIMAIPIVLSFFCSFSIELLQEFATSSRFFEIIDILANGIGCLIAFFVMKKQFFNKLKYK